MVNVVVWGQWIYKRACCQNQFCISPGGSMHYHNTSSADWGCEFIITTKKRAGWGFSTVDIQMFHWNGWEMTIQSKVTVFSSLHVQYTVGFVLFLDPQMSFDSKLSRHWVQLIEMRYRIQYWSNQFIWILNRRWPFMPPIHFLSRKFSSCYTVHADLWQSSTTRLAVPKQF